MYEKICLFCLVCILFVGCNSTRILDNGNGIDSARENLSELEEEQRNIEERLGEVTDGVETLEVELTEGLVELEERLGESITSLAERTDDFYEFERILNRVRGRKKSSNNSVE